MSTISVNQEQNQLAHPKQRNLPLPSGYRVPVRKNSEYTDDLLRRVYQSLPMTDALVVGVVSVTDENVNSVTTINLAMRATDYLVTPTLLVDANLKSARISRKFNARRPGFADYVSGKASLQESVSKAKNEEFHVMGVGNRRWGQDQSIQPSILREMREEYRLSLIEFPPLVEPSTMDTFVSELDGIILLASYGQKRRQLQKLTSRLRSCGGEVVGLVLTGRPSTIPTWISRWF